MYIIDNGSTDDSISIITNSYPTIRVIRLKENLGFAGGYNKGLSYIDAEVYILLNSDVRVTPNWTNGLLNYLAKHENVGAVMPAILSDKNPDLYEYAGAAGGYLDRYGYAYCRGRIFDQIESVQGQYEDIVSVAWATGCAMAVRAKVFHGLKGFDAQFFVHYEEIDLCWRMQRAGYSCYCIPKSRLYHLGGGTMPYASSNKLFYNFRNSLFMHYKNSKGIHRLKLILARLLLDGLAGIVFLWERKFTFFIAVLKAHFSFYAALPYLRRQSKQDNQLISKISIGKEINVMSPYSIVSQFFIRKNRTFSSFHKMSK